MKIVVTAALLLAAVPADAAVKSASPNSFEIEHRVPLSVAPEAAYRSLGRVGSWWSPDHTYSGKAARLSLDLRPGGCFCEQLDGGGGVEHMRVSYVQPGKRAVLTGSLGPLLFEATAGVMDLRLESAAEGAVLVMNYRAAGFANGNADKLAPVVDRVLGEQAKRFGDYAGKGRVRP